MSTVPSDATVNVRFASYGWLLAAIAAIAAAALLQTGVTQMVRTWLGREEYSHALLIPFICGYLLWQQRAELAQLELKGSWGGAVLAICGALLQVMGMLAALDVIQQYGLLL